MHKQPDKLEKQKSFPIYLKLNKNLFVCQMNKTFFFVHSLCTFLALVAIANSFICTQEMYEQYLKHWDRNFTDEKLTSEYSSKFNLYCENRKYINDINSQNLNYTLDTFWQWMDKPKAELDQIIRVELPIDSIVSSAVPIEQVEGLRKVSATVPATYDLRVSGDVSSIKSQGNCGCCWSFTTVGMYESFMMLKGEQEYDLSEEYLLECTTLYTQNVKRLSGYTSACSGGYVDFSGQLAKVNGIPTQANFPYIAYNFTGTGFPSTSGICQANQTVMYARDPSVTTFAVAKNNTNDKMKELISNGPVGALIYANTGFQSYKSGIYSGCPSSFTTSYNNINHAVVIIGYDANGNYIVKNSWGSSWGENGYGIVDKNNDCGLSAYAFQYTSTAAPGGGVLFYNQTKMDTPTSSESKIMSTSLIVLVMVLLTIIN